MEIHTTTDKILLKNKFEFETNQASRIISLWGKKVDTVEYVKQHYKNVINKIQTWNSTAMLLKVWSIDNVVHKLFVTDL